MAIYRIITIWGLVILAIIVSSDNVIAQSPFPAPVGAPGPGTTVPDCMTLIYNMSDCLTYVSKGSKTAKPDKPCCPELAGMLDSNPLCLCQMMGNNKDLPIELDVSRALKLPNACGLKTPPLSLCSAVGIPVGGPAGAPISNGPSSSVAGTPTGAPVGALTPSGGMISPMAGGPSAGKNGASNAYFNLVYLIAGLSMTLTLLNL